MRLWSLHPKHLDARGLVALWREALLAQAVLMGKTKGYLNHSQLIRFKEQDSPLDFIAEYLRHVQQEATNRGYHFSATKIGCYKTTSTITVTGGQMEFEWKHLLAKLKVRDQKWLNQLSGDIQPHPIFRVIPGDIEKWERV
jgi:hypothetical protein